MHYGCTVCMRGRVGGPAGMRAIWLMKAFTALCTAGASIPAAQQAAQPLEKLKGCTIKKIASTPKSFAVACKEGPVIAWGGDCMHPFFWFSTSTSSLMAMYFSKYTHGLI